MATPATNDPLGEKKGPELYGRLDARLRVLAQRPLLLWLMKEAGAAGEDLPGNRGELYERFVDRMLERDRYRFSTDIPDSAKLEAASHLACVLNHQHTLFCKDDEAVEIVDEVAGDISAREMIDVLARHGLLIRDGKNIRFPYQTLQEHFAARALHARAKSERKGRASKLAEAVRCRLGEWAEGLETLAKDDWWTEPFVQLAGLTDDPDGLAQAIVQPNPWLAWWCVEEGRAVNPDVREKIEAQSIRLLRSNDVTERRRAVQTLAQMQGERVEDALLEPLVDEDDEVRRLALQSLLERGEIVRPRVVNRLLDILRDDKQVKPVIRAWAGRELGKLGDPRPGVVGVLQAKDLPLIPDMELCYVPSGPFWMGSDGYDDEKPAHLNERLDYNYWIGRYPVTNAQFRCFVEAPDGYQNDRWWTEAGLEWRKDRIGPDDRGEPYSLPNHPVVYITWYEALAFTSWLTAVWRRLVETRYIASLPEGLEVRLPSEAEWEKAARGGLSIPQKPVIRRFGEILSVGAQDIAPVLQDNSNSKRAYPWDDGIDPNWANYYGAGIGTTSAMGCFPGGASPYRCEDMSGNVWEWTRSRYRDYPYQPDDGREKLEGDAPRVWRGGSFSLYVGFARCAFRLRGSPFYHGNFAGFRVAAVLAHLSPL